MNARRSMALKDQEGASVGDVRASGKHLRQAVPREAHGEWKPGPDRADPLTLLDEQNRTRIPELVPVRMGRMAASAFSFYRGAAAVMAADLASTPVTGIEVARMRGRPPVQLRAVRVTGAATALRRQRLR
jgi:hypothetical protein